MSLPFRSAAVLLLVAGLVGSCAGEGCGGEIDSPDASTPDAGPTSLRCPMPLEVFLEDCAASGSGAYVRQVASTGDLIGGPTAAGRIGDWLIGNDKVRVIVQGEGRAIGPHPYGGTLLDADTVHDGPGNDQLGEIGLIYNFSRTIDPQLFEILRGRQRRRTGHPRDQRTGRGQRLPRRAQPPEGPARHASGGGSLRAGAR